MEENSRISWTFVDSSKSEFPGTTKPLLRQSVADDVRSEFGDIVALRIYVLHMEENVEAVGSALGEGHWTLNGAPLPLVEGALDIDLGFTPATNLLPIRRLDLAVGERADVRTVWVRFPELRVEALEQSYRREATRVFRYDALVDGERYQARLDTDDFGRVLLYEGLWEAEADT